MNESVLMERFEEEMLLMEQNDPRCTVVDITQNDISPYHNVDWAERGGAIASNTHLKSLYVELFDDAPGWKDVNSFYRALSLNRSITDLSINCCLRDVKNMFEEMLIPFFHDNDTICMFEFDGDINSMSSQWLVSALTSNNKKSLRQITLTSIGSMHMATVINEIAEHENIKVLSLNVYNEDDDDMIYDEEAWCTAVGNLLIHPLSKLEELTLNDCHHEQVIRDEGLETFFGFLASSSLEELLLSHRNISDEALAVLGTSLATSSLKVLSLAHNQLITSQGWVTFFESIVDSGLEELNLKFNGISDEALAMFVNSLAGISTLKVFLLRNNRLITEQEQGWLHFFNQLHGMPGLTLESLDLSGNIFGVQGNESLVNGLANMQSLRSLDVSRYDPSDPVVPGSIVESPSHDPRMAITTESLLYLLQSHSSNLKHLCVSIVDINEELCVRLAASLVDNSSLESLYIVNNNFRRSRMLPWVDAALWYVLCNKSSIESIYNSNHTLQRINFSDRSCGISCIDSQIYYKTKFGEPIDTYLELNKSGDSKNEVARRKVIKYYFDNGDRNIQEIVDMELNELPLAIEWSGRNEAGLSLLYRLLRSVPFVFE